MRVLIVEDDPVTANSMVEYLKLCGNEVFRASNNTEAQTLAKNINFDVALIDWILYPQNTGIDLIRWLRANGFRQPLALMTGADNQQFKDLLKEIGHYDKIIGVQKPIEANEIIERLKVLL